MYNTLLAGEGEGWLKQHVYNTLLAGEGEGLVTSSFKTSRIMLTLLYSES